MKLRLQSDSLRVRLNEQEVQQLARQGCLEESITLAPGQILSYRLELAPVDSPTASLQQCKLLIRIPEVSGRAWALSEEVQLESRSGAVCVARLTIERDIEPARKHQRPLEAKT